MRPFFGLVILGSLCWTAGQPAAFAQGPSEEEELAQIYGDKLTVSIATGARQTLRRAPAVASVITAQDIAAMGATDLDQVLETVPGLHVSRTNLSYSPLYQIRGIVSEFNPQVLMLQNGVPMTTLYTGSRGVVWAGLPVANIARVEVIRGPGSALYGADAYAGVINIVTKGAADVAGTEIGATLGSFSTRDVWLQHGGKIGPVSVAAFLRSGRSNGARELIPSDAQTGFDALFGTRASLAPGFTSLGYDALDAGLDLALDHWRLQVGHKRRTDVGVGAGGAGAVDPVGRVASQRSHINLGLNDLALSQNWRFNLNASLLSYVQKLPGPVVLFPAGAFGGAFPNGMLGSPNTWERQTRMGAALAYSGWAGHQLRIGMGHDDLNLYRTREYRNFSLISSGPFTGLPVPTPSGQVELAPVAESFLAPHRRRISYAYVQDEWSIAKDWTLTGGVRRDRYSDFGSTTNPRLALVWDASLDVTAKLLYGSAFRAPSFDEQYGVNPVTAGNANIRPERIKTLEAAVQWQLQRAVMVSVNLFSYRMDDLIKTTPNPAPAPGATYRNAFDRRGHGGELEWAWDVRRDLRLAGGYGYQRSTEVQTDSPAGYAPTQHLNARVDWALRNGLNLNARINYVSTRARAAGDNRPALPGSTTLDVTLRLPALREGWDLSLAALNLFNADVREPSRPSAGLADDLPLPRRTFNLLASYRF